MMNKLNISSRLMIGFGVFILCLAAMVFITFNTLKKSEEVNAQLNNVQYPAVIELGNFQEMLLESKELAKQWAFVQRSAEHPEHRRFIVLCDMDFPKASTRLIELSEHWSSDEKALLDTLLFHYNRLSFMYRDIRDLLKRFEDYADPAKSILAEDYFLEGSGIPRLQQQINLCLDRLKQHFNEEISQETEAMNQRSAQLKFLLISIGAFILISGWIIAWLTTRSIVRPLRAIMERLKSLSFGIYDHTPIHQGKDEIGEMGIAVTRLIENFDRTKNFAQAIGNGETTSPYQPLSDQDEMGFALVQMQQDLQSYREEMEQKVSVQTEELRNQKEEADSQKDKIINLYADLRSSIDYAQRLQQSILPKDTGITDLFIDSFIYYVPKDIVSGDFYWFQQNGSKKLFAVADCTGHGVPGAFMSLISYNALNHVTKVFTQPAQILNQINRIAVKSFSASKDENIRDGMDVSFCSYDTKTGVLEFAGAQQRAYVVRNKEVFELIGDKFSIGFSEIQNRVFETRRFNCEKGDMVYLLSDGYVDQFGGAENKKFMRFRFKQMLQEIHTLHPKVQREHMHLTFENWKGNLEQLDDVLVMGIRI
jgi:serine phosphatase RsbU (regulator of sigma subunit)/HAMP domain-containing protein